MIKFVLFCYLLCGCVIALIVSTVMNGRLEDNGRLKVIGMMIIDLLLIFLWPIIMWNGFKDSKNIDSETMWKTNDEFINSRLKK